VCERENEKGRRARREDWREERNVLVEKCVGDYTSETSNFELDCRRSQRERERKKGSLI